MLVMIPPKHSKQTPRLRMRPHKVAPVANKGWKKMCLLVMFAIALWYYSWRVFHRQTHLLEFSCGFRKFRDPLHHEGLPYLSEVFATEDSVYFAGVNGGICDRSWRGAHDFWGHDFVCEFPDGTKVTSDPVPPTRGDPWADSLLLIRCDLPVQYRIYVENEEAGTTQLVVHLHATMDLEHEEEKSISKSHATLTDEFGVFRNLPVCPRKWPQTKKNPKKTAIRAASTATAPSPSSKRKYVLTMATQIRMEYETFEADARYTVRVKPLDVVSWLEYNLMIGFEHFYIYDNDPTEHGVLEKLLKSYVEEGLVDYVWYPMQDCYLDTDDELNGNRLTISQATSSTMSLRRYEHETTFMGHFDIDEYIQLPGHVTDLKQVLKETPSNIVSVTVTQQWFHDCANSQDPTGQPLLGSPLTRILCVNADSTPPKAIMRTREVLGSFVHGPWVKMNHALFDWDADSLVVHGLSIAHLRGPRARDNLNASSLGQQYVIPSPEDRAKLQRKIAERMEILGM